LLLLVALLTSVSLGNGLAVDDHMHKGVFLGRSLSHPPGHPTMTMFQFFDGNPQTTKRLLETGYYPWWTHSSFKGALWRPVSAATHWLDYKLWPNAHWLMHLHSILWMMLVLWAASMLYQSILPGKWVAQLALLLFVLNDMFGMPVGWLANRNALVSLFFSILSLLFHHRWRQGDTKHALTASFFFVVSLLSAEAGIATCGYLFGYALFLDKRTTIFRKALSIAHYGVLVVMWRIVYSYLGYGMRHSDMYIDPIHDWSRFLYDMGYKLPVLLMGEWLPLATPDVFLLLTGPARWGFVLLGVCFTVGLGALCWPLRHNPTARFWGTGMLLSLIPVCATMPHSRLLLFSALGGMGLLAMLGAQWLEENDKAHNTNRSLWYKRALFFLIGAHLVVGCIGLPAKALMVRTITPFSDRIAQTTKVQKGKENHTLVIVNSSVLLLDLINIERKRLAGEPHAKRLRVLAPAHGSVSIKRIDEYTLEVLPHKGFFFVFERLFRSSNDPMKVGEQFVLSDMTATIKKVDPAGMPLVVTYRFKYKLESPALRWLQAKTGGGYRPFVPPAQNESVTLPPFRPF
jgi:hypothetical protein